LVAGLGSPEERHPLSKNTRAAAITVPCSPRQRLSPLVRQFPLHIRPYTREQFTHASLRYRRTSFLPEPNKAV